MVARSFLSLKEAAFVAEVILTMFPVPTVLGSTDVKAPVEFAGLANRTDVAAASTCLPPRKAKRASASQQAERAKEGSGTRLP
jgi:hypothetical protein